MALINRKRVFSFATLSDFPTVGEVGIVYINLASSDIYLWSGSAYVLPAGSGAINDPSFQFNTYADLPDPTTVDVHVVYVVRRTTGVWGVNRKQNGLWQVQNDGGANFYKYLGLVPSTLVKTNVVFNADNKLVKTQGTSDNLVEQTLIEIDDSNNLDMKAGGFKDNNATTAILLGDATNTSFNTTNKTIVGSVNENKLEKESAIGTVLLWGGEISINADNTKFDIEAGSARFVDNYTDDENPTSTTITWAKQEAITVTNIGTQLITYLSVNVSGTFVQSSTPISNGRVAVPLGTLVHTNLTSISKASSFTDWGKDIFFLIADLYSALGNRLNSTGNEFNANGANLNLDKSLGSMTGVSINYTDKTNPNVLANAADTALTFFTLYRDTPTGVLTSVNEVPNTHYDPNGDGTLVAIPEGYYVNHRIYFDPSSGITILQYAQFAYDSLKKASTSWEQEDFIKDPIISGVSLRTILVIARNCTELNDPDCTKFIQMGALGDVDFRTIESFTRFADTASGWSGMSTQRPSITYVNDGGTIYEELAADFSFERSDISFANADSSINTAAGDFDVNALVAGDKITVSGSTNNNGEFTVASVATLKIVVSESITDESAGATIEINTPGLGDIEYYFRDREFTLDCTTGSGTNGRARVALTAGTATVPVQQYSYVTKNGQVAQLNVSTTFPTGEFAWVCDVLVPDATTFDTLGVYSSQRYSDNKSHDGRGAVSYEREKIRSLGTSYESGAVPTITITDLADDTVDFATTSGEIYQMHKSTFPAQDSATDGIFVINHPTTPWLHVTEIGDIQIDANGDTLENKAFNFVFVGIQSSANGVNYSRLGLLLPNGSYGYTQLSRALSDEDNTAVTSVPASIKKTAFLIARVTFKFKITTGDVWNNVTADETSTTFFDLRGNPLGATTGGAGTPSVTTFSDDAFQVFNLADPTKLIKFSGANITTGQTRTITMADANVDLADIALNNTHRTSNGSDHTYINQDVTTTGTPTFAGLGINEASPETPLEITTTSPYITLHNSTHTNGADARKSRFIGKGEKADGTEHTLGSMDFSHSGSGDDQKGEWILRVNDGNDGDTLLEGLTFTTSGENDGFFTVKGIQSIFAVDPLLNIQNITQSDADGARQSRVKFVGSRSGSGQDTLVDFLIQHDGAGADGKGRIIIRTNDGSDGDTPTERIRIDSAGLFTIAGNIDITGDLDVDNININGNTISSTDTNGNIILDPDGTGKVGVNTASPQTRLHVDDDNAATGGISIGTSSSTDCGNMRWVTSTNHWNIDNSSGEMRFFTETGYGTGGVVNMKLGTTGTFFLPNLATVGAVGSLLRYDVATGQIRDQVCSRRYKENIVYTDEDQTITDHIIGVIDGLKVSRYDYKDGCVINKIGLIAEDVHELDETLTYKKEIDGELLVEGYNDVDIVPYLVTYVQEQKKTIEAQQLLINDLLTRVSALEGGE
jgi:hypothetical protein